MCPSNTERHQPTYVTGARLLLESERSPFGRFSLCFQVCIHQIIILVRYDRMNYKLIGIGSNYFIILLYRIIRNMLVHPQPRNEIFHLPKQIYMFVVLNDDTLLLFLPLSDLRCKLIPTNFKPSISLVIRNHHRYTYE